MKLQKVLVISGIVSVLCVVTTIFFLKSDSILPKKTHPVQFEASEGTKEDPFARARYNWARLRNPETNEIPRNIGTKEIAFVNELAKQTSKTHHSLTD